MTPRVPITFQPADVTVWVEPGVTVVEAARSAGILLAAPCGGRGVCGSCGVKVLKGHLAEPDEVELSGIRSHRPIRLACRARVVAPVSVRPLVVGEAVASGSGASPADRRYVAGVDLGTTTVAAVLIESATGREVGRASVPNRQQAFGADVVARVAAAMDGCADELRRAAEDSVRHALSGAAEASGADSQSVDRVVIAGNSAMSALFTGADVASLATHPFDAPVSRPVPADSPVRSLVSPECEFDVVPSIAGFVGGDASAATLAAGMLDSCEPILLVDFGTNAEIVLAHNGLLIVASAAAGPAFEGGGLSCGGPAALGAVVRVGVSPEADISYETLGDRTPAWFSGSGLVSALAELKRHGHLGEDGALRAEGVLASRFGRDEHGVLGVSLGEDSDGCLRVSQLDVRALQLAKAAVRVGVDAVLRHAGLSAEDLCRVVVAGAFGSALDSADLVSLGVLPAAIVDRVEKAGNAALAGAALLALDPGLREQLVTATASASHVDLALEPGFSAALVAATSLEPYTR